MAKCGVLWVLTSALAVIQVAYAEPPVPQATPTDPRAPLPFAEEKRTVGYSGPNGFYQAQERFRAMQAQKGKNPEDVVLPGNHPAYHIGCKHN